MRSKRKASQVFTTASPTKRREQWNHNYVVTSSDEEDTSTDEIEDEPSDEEWEIKGIQDENQSEYLIDWVGPYSPTWEPKDNASEFAIQVWEEKKKKKRREAQLVSECSSVQPSSSQSQSQPHSAVSHQRAETPQREPVLQQHVDSPLFVPLDSVSQAQSQNTNGPPPSNLTTGSASRPTNTKAPTRRNCDNVFEYYPRAPIPSEYCLPGEFEEQREATTGTVPTPETRNSNLTEEISDRLAIFRQTTAAQATLRSEIPETPSIPFAASQSQIPRAGPRFPTFGSQQSAGPTQLPFSNISLDYLSNPHTSTGSPNPASSTDPRPVYPPFIHTASVPESASANTLQHLNTLSSTTYTLYTSSNTLGLSQLAPARQPSATRRLSSSDSLSRISQRLIGDTGFLPVTSTQNKGSAPIHLPRTSGTMDDQTQKDEGGSLAQAMEKYSHMDGSTPREKIMNLHARFREKSAFESRQNDPSATPSSVGDIEASEPPSIPETVAPLSVRVDKEPSHADLTKESVPETSLDEAEPQEHEHDNIQTIHPSALSISHTEEKSPGSLHLGPSEFAVPLPMDSRVKDDYERILLTDSENALGLIGADRPQGDEGSEPEHVISLMQQVLERLSNAATHPDINVAQHMKDAESKLEQEAAWAEYSSAKFLLLNYLIKAAGDHDIHLVIMVRGEKTHRVLEHYLEGKGFEYTRPREEMGSGTNAEVSMVKGSLSFGVQAARSEGIVETYKAPSALIALDSSLNIKNPSVEHMRTTFARNGHLLPVIRLMVANSSEHVELCFPGPSTTEHLYMLIQYSLELRDIVGDLQDDALGVHEDVNEIMTCLLSDNFDAFWSLPPVEPLREAHLDEPSQSETPIQSDGENAHPANPQAQKRLFAEESIEPSSKKPRMDESQDTSQFTDSSKGASQTLESQIQFLEKSMVQKKSEDAAALETLQKELAAAESRLQEREKILGSLQHRYESRTNDLHKIRQERDRLLETKSASEQRVEKQKEDITKLKDERSQLKLDLEQAREALKNGGGDMAELEKAREEVRRLTKANESLERKADFANKQAEYTREQYQTASNVAAQSGNELRQLKEENEALTRRVAGEASRLREMNLKNDENHHLSRIAELEAQLSSREYLLRKKEDELHEIRKNRPSTRSTSTQPRSPKLTAGNHSRPTSPGLNNNGSNFPGRGSALRFSSEMSL